MKMKNFLSEVLRYQKENCTHGLKNSDNVCKECESIILDSRYGNTYEVEWWEERIYRCSITVKARSKEIAEQIAMEPGTEGIRTWSSKEQKTYSEYLKDVTDSEHINTIGE